MDLTCSCGEAQGFGNSECPYLISAYIFAGLAMMLNIRLAYSSAPYALIRFRLPENLFSVFVRRMASALELWCLPSMLMGNIVDTAQKFIGGHEGFRSKAGTSPTDGGKLRALAQELYNKANDLDVEVKKVDNDANAAKVLKAKAGTSVQASDTKYLRKLAEKLYNESTSLASQAPAKGDADNAALKQKAGTNPNDGLRKLAKDLHHKAQALATAVTASGVASDSNAASNLANEVGQDENNGIRKKLKELADYVAADTGLPQKATAVRYAYEGGTGVKALFQLVQTKNRESAYASGPAKAAYLAVEEAWNAFNTLYEADLRQLATDLKTAIGTASDNDKLQGALAALGNLPDSDPQLRNKAGKVREAYQNGGNGVKPKFNLVKAKGPSYQAIAAIKPHYDKVAAAMTAFDNVYKPEELFMNEVGNGNSEGSGLQEALKNLGGAPALSSGLSSKAQAVKTQYATVKSKFELVKAQENAYSSESSNIKNGKYTPLVSAWNAFNNAYKEALTFSKMSSIIYPSILTMWSDFLTYVVLLFIYITGGEHGRVTAYYGVIAVSGFIFGINMTLVYAADWQYIPVYLVGENSFPAVTSLIHYFTTLMFGNRRRYNSDYLIVTIDIVVAIIISFTTASLWTITHLATHKSDKNTTNAQHWHILPAEPDTDTPHPDVISPTLMVIVGMGLVYAIYPGIAPGMIVPFYLIDKIEMVLLIMTAFPPVIVAMLQRLKPEYSPKAKYVWPTGMGGWKQYEHTPKFDEPDTKETVHNWFWHFFDILIVIKISLAVIFIYSLHYRESSISRSIVNQPKMSTFLSIVFYMCHEILLALGFPGIVGNNGVQFIMLPAQYVGALFMIFLAFYSEGYIIEYKSNDPAHWPTEGMTPWNAFCYWAKRESKIKITA
uniref:Theileria-specific sub-telomeric protein, putative n=1 Tax=Theileria annulata TaxID=5874 RepID=A0A3B0MK45_THEAN